MRKACTKELTNQSVIFLRLAKKKNDQSEGRESTTHHVFPLQGERKKKERKKDPRTVARNPRKCDVKKNYDPRINKSKREMATKHLRIKVNRRPFDCRIVYKIEEEKLLFFFLCGLWHLLLLRTSPPSLPPPSHAYFNSSFCLNRCGQLKE